MYPLWFYKHQHDNRVRSKLFVACQRWWFQWRFWFVLSVPGCLREEEEYKPDPWRNPIQRNHMGLHLENEVVKTPKIIWNNPVQRCGKKVHCTESLAVYVVDLWNARANLRVKILLMFHRYGVCWLCVQVERLGERAGRGSQFAASPHRAIVLEWIVSL